MMVGRDLCLFARPADVAVRSTVGAGDAMVAGIVAGLDAGAPVETAFRMGAASAGAAVATQEPRRRPKTCMSASIKPYQCRRWIKMTGVAIMGCGTVGSGAMKMLTDNARIISRAAGREVALTHVMDIRPVDAPEGVAQVATLDEALESENTRIFVESIGGVGVAYELTRRALAAGRHVVTSNKELVAERGDELTLWPPGPASRTGLKRRWAACRSSGP